MSSTGKHPIELSADDLMRQAKMTAHDYLLAAINDIDETLGQGTARKHPELIAAYIQTAAMDFAGGIIAQQIRAGLDHIAEVLEERKL
jgi:hypothetical protein